MSDIHNTKCHNTLSSLLADLVIMDLNSCGSYLKDPEHLSHPEQRT